MFRASRAVVLAAVLVLLGATPVMADQGFEYEIDATYYDNVNPCTGELHDVTYQWTGRVHVHNGNYLEKPSNSTFYAFTTDGYEAFSAGINLIVTPDEKLFIRPGHGVFRHPDGSAYTLHQMVVYDIQSDELRVLFGGTSCIGEGRQN